MPLSVGALHMTTEVARQFHLALEWCSCIIIACALASRIMRKKATRTQKGDSPAQELALTHRAKTLEALLREVNHRVKNNFTSLVGLLQMKQEFAQTPHEASQLKEMEIKLTGLANVHQMLALNGWNPITLEELCRSLVRSIVSLSGVPCQFTITATPRDLKISHAQTHPLILIIQELTSNAVKHAVVPGVPLIITLSLKEQDASILLCFKDNGPGYPAFILERFPRLPTTGLHILHDLTTSSLRGSLSLSNQSGALTCALFPQYPRHSL